MEDKVIPFESTDDSIPSAIVEKSDWTKIAVAVGIGIVLGAMGLALVILAGGTTQFLSDQECNNQTLFAYQIGVQNGIIQTANYTTMSGNFTYIYNNSIRTQGVENYCVAMIQNLNQNGGT